MIVGFQDRSEGFTLVELSIVLVIIGLLIGGILVAQSMIGTAKLQNFVRQIQQIDIAVNNFQTKYNSIPGDSQSFEPGGNNDGVIDGGYGCADDTNGVPPYGNNVMIESSVFFVHLQQSDPGFLPQYKFVAVGSPETSADNTFSATSPNATFVPIAYGRYSKGSGILAVPGGCTNETNQWPNNSYNGSKAPNGYLIEPYSNGHGTLLDDFAWTFLPAEVLAYDEKVDDGLALSGNVHSTAGYTCANGSGKYDATQITPVCDLSIKMLSQVGQ